MNRTILPTELRRLSTTPFLSERQLKRLSVEPFRVEEYNFEALAILDYPAYCWSRKFTNMYSYFQVYMFFLEYHDLYTCILNTEDGRFKYCIVNHTESFEGFDHNEDTIYDTFLEANQEAVNALIDLVAIKLNKNEIPTYQQP